MTQRAATGVTIRAALPDDAPAIAFLAGELGYPVTEAEARERLLELRAGDDVLVAELDGRVVGWIHLATYRTLVLEPHAQVLGLVVAGDVRGQGIGTALMTRAESWALERGLTAIHLRSRAEREAAHRFYLGLDFELRKTSRVFTKRLGPA